MKFLKKPLPHFAFFILTVLSLKTGASPSEKIIYEIKSSTQPQQLNIEVARNSNHKDLLILKGSSMGIKSQISEVSCDGHPLKELKPGEWEVSHQCKKIAWKTALADTSATLASEQQSSRSNLFTVFSVVSSLPRLQKTTAEFLKISLPEVKTTFPEKNSNQLIPLTSFSGPPQFILFNPIRITVLNSGPLQVVYYIDDPKNKAQIPQIKAHLLGLQWLYSIMQCKNPETFTLVWLGAQSSQPILTGATGSDSLLVNYPTQGQYPFGAAMLLYVALHEAFHQLSLNYSSQPVWMAESLASYYGMMALKQALPEDSQVQALLQRFETAGARFNAGLFTYNEQLDKGNSFARGAFYTKGISFWSALDQQLLKTYPHKNLNIFLPDLLKQADQVQQSPSALEKILPLPKEEWDTLRKNFLD